MTPMIDTYAGRTGRLSLPIAFASAAAILVLFAAAASAPTPLYVVYQREWGFSTTTLTVIFAVYVAGLIGLLLVLGALGSGALFQFAPAPTQLVFGVLVAGAAVAALAVARMPETSVRRPGAVGSLIPQLGIPARLRPDIFALVPIVVASWALGGLYLSLGPSVAASLFGLSNHLIGGVVVTLLFGTGALTAFVLRTWPAHRVLTISAISLSAGTALTLGGVEAHAVGLSVAG